MKRKAYATIRSLYGELEAARRVWEDERDRSWKQQSEGAQAYVLWLELLDIAEWLGGGATSEDDGEESVDPDEDQDDASDGSDGESDVPIARSLDGVEQARVHPAAGVQAQVAPDELLQQPLPGAVGGAVPGLTYSVNKRKNATPRGR